MNSSQPGMSMAWRAALAVALMVGFYGLAVGISWGLLWIPYAEWHYANRLHLKIAAFCVVGAFLIGRSILPRRDRFEAPGPVLVPQAHPELFAELRGVAEAVGQEMPAEVYLVPDVNAWVSQRGGLMGFGGRRVMALGLPLLQALRIPELRAVIAHEFGHYHGGDVKLGPWIYKTREALGRTIDALAEHSTVLSKPFLWYGALFLRISHAVSRHQELQADALAAAVAGGSALASGLRSVHEAGLAFGAYWSQEVHPVASAGFLPPVAAGFSRFVAQPAVAEEIRKATEAELREGRQDPYDTHPSLRDRLAALGQADGSGDAADGPLAITLLSDLMRLEAELLAVFGDGRAGSLEPVSWEAVGHTVYVPQWEAFLSEHSPNLAGMTPESLASLDWEGLGKRLAAAAQNPPEAATGMAEYAVGAALAVALTRLGFSVDAPPGAPVALRRGEQRLEPFGVRKRLAEGAAETERWASLCAGVGIAGLDLGAPATAAAATATPGAASVPMAQGGGGGASGRGSVPGISART